MSVSSPGWKNRPPVFEHEHGKIVRQTRSKDGKRQTRLRVTLNKDDVVESFYLRVDELFDLTEMLDDLCDAIEDGEFDV